MTRQGQLAPGVVQVRLSGLPDDAAVLAGIPAVQILTGPDGPYPNRRQPGHRLYLTLRLTEPPRRPSTPETTHTPRGGPSHDGATPMTAHKRRKPPMTTGPAARADTGTEVANPDTPIPYTLTRKPRRTWTPSTPS